MSTDTRPILDPLEIILQDARSDLRSCEESIRSKAEQIARSAARTAEAVAAGRHTNSLGEIQSAGPELDRLCAIRAERYSALRRIEWALRRCQERQALSLGLYACHRCGRCTADGDLWDPDAYSGEIYCDRCWPEREKPQSAEEEEAARLLLASQISEMVRYYS